MGVAAAGGGWWVRKAEVEWRRQVPGRVIPYRATGRALTLSVHLAACTKVACSFAGTRAYVFVFLMYGTYRIYTNTHTFPCTLPLEEEGERAEEGGGEHETVGDEDADVHAVVQRELDEDLQRREDELHRDHGHRRLRAVHHHTAATTGPHATTTGSIGCRLKHQVQVM